jgi:cathepsin A (carboxypeptidase C)
LKRGQSDQTADKIYYDSSDNQLGYPCDNGDRARTYFSQPEVLTAYHIDEAWIKAGNIWGGCNMALNANYPVKYNDTTEIFKYIINVATNNTQFVKNFRILIYNGDVDTVCNFLGDSWHIDNIANQMNLTTMDRNPWVFRHQYAGYHQPYYTSYNNGTNNFTIDVLTVKGSGHFVPNDKQGPSLQMITNFIRGTNNYNSTNNFQVLPSPQPGINATSPTPQSSTISSSNIASLNCLLGFFVLFLTLH